MPVTDETTERKLSVYLLVSTVKGVTFVIVLLYMPYRVATCMWRIRGGRESMAKAWRPLTCFAAVINSSCDCIFLGFELWHMASLQQRFQLWCLPYYKTTWGGIQWECVKFEATHLHYFTPKLLFVTLRMFVRSL